MRLSKYNMKAPSFYAPVPVPLDERGTQLTASINSVCVEIVVLRSSERVEMMMKHGFAVQL